MRVSLNILMTMALWGTAIIADDADVTTAQGPIVVQPADDDDPTIVTLGEEQGDPLLIEPFELIDQNGETFSSEETGRQAMSRR